MNYILKNKLGQGGMATVFLAENPKFHTDIAMKVLNKEFIYNDNIKKRFIAEARNMFRMSHPNIIKVIDLIDEEDLVAFVMEYIEGETLKEYLERKGKLSDEEIRTIFPQMLDAVGYVHEQNLVHRDIKPSNFMIDKKGKLKLMDFGIAKNTDASSAEYTQTGTGMQMGTPMYMSPEQITETKSVTSQSDIYSLGVVLWQMVTGEKPYDTQTLSNFQLQIKIVNEILEKTNSKWDSIIQKATIKNQFERYRTCDEWGKELDFKWNREKVKNNDHELEKTILEFESPIRQQTQIGEEKKDVTHQEPIKNHLGYSLYQEFKMKRIPLFFIYIFLISNLILIIGLLSIPYYTYFSESYNVSYFNVMDYIDGGDQPSKEIMEEFNRATYLSTVFPMISLFYNAIFLLVLVFYVRKKIGINYLNFILSILSGLYMLNMFGGNDPHWFLSGYYIIQSLEGSFEIFLIPFISIVLTLFFNYKLLKSD